MSKPTPTNRLASGPESGQDRRMVGTIQRLRSTLRHMRGHPVWGWSVLAFGAAGTVFFAYNPQSPGIPIGLLATVAVIVTVFEPTVFQKIAVVTLAVGLYAIEVHAIKADHAAQDRSSRDQLKDILKDNREKTGKILSANQAAFSATETHFSAVINDDKTIKALSRNAFEEITGGNSYLYMEPLPTRKSGNIGFAVWNKGDRTLNSISSSMRRITDDQLGLVPVYISGTLPPHTFSESFTFITPQAGKDGMDKYWVILGAQNGFTSEYLDFRKNPAGQWEYRFKVMSVKIPVHAMNDPHNKDFNQRLLYARPWGVAKTPMDSLPGL